MSAVGEQASRIEGSVFYRERIALPPGAEVTVQLEDISRADAPAEVLATVTMSPKSGPPYDFFIDYDPAQIDERMRYALRAAIRVGDRLMFTNTEFIDAFGGNPVQVLVQRVPSAITPEGPALENTLWQLQTLAGETAPVGSQGKSIDLQFDGEGQRAGGFSGCNRYSGGYQREGNSSHGSPLSFGLMAGTMMACPDVGDLEQVYLKALGDVDGFRIEQDVLALLMGDAVIATYRAQGEP